MTAVLATNRWNAFNSHTLFLKPVYGVFAFSGSYKNGRNWNEPEVEIIKKVTRNVKPC